MLTIVFLGLRTIGVVLMILFLCDILRWWVKGYHLPWDRELIGMAFGIACFLVAWLGIKKLARSNKPRQ